MLKGKSQLDPQEVIRDRRVASKRIHIERVIGLSKGFKILRHSLPQRKLHLGSRIVFVCFSLSYFRKSIVDRNAYYIFCATNYFIIVWTEVTNFQTEVQTNHIHSLMTSLVFYT